MTAAWIAVTGAALLVVGCAPSADPGADGASSPAPPSGSSTPLGPGDCPAGSAPDQPGASDQARPAAPAGAWFQLAAMEPSGSGIIVGESGLEPEGAGWWSLLSLWTFDVCTNSWQEQAAPAGSAPPNADSRTAMGQFVAHDAAGLILGLPVGLAPVFAFDPTTNSWAQRSTTGGGGEAWPLAVYDPDGQRLLAFEAHNSTVQAYDLEDDAWSVLDSGESSTASVARPNARMDQVDIAYDSAEQQLILVITRPGALDESAETWAFAPDSATWSRRADVPNTLELGYPAGWAMAFDPVDGRTWLFAETAMLAYDAGADEWTVAERGPGWPTTTMLGDVQVDPVARLVSTLVVDSINNRLVAIGGLVRRAGDPVGGFEFENSTVPTDDVWAYDPATNTWTLLLAASANPASFGPG
jgi:hypothetical protein